MYAHPAFAEVDTEVIVGLLRAAGFGHLVVASADGLDATPIPFVVSDDVGSVRMHVARPNSIWRHAPCDALLIVPVTDAYVSPSWYPSKAADGRVVPTWNYEVVHVTGRLHARDDGAWVLQQINDLTDTNEAALVHAWSVNDAPADYIAKLQRGIVGIELAVTGVTAKRKLSQNKPEADQAGVVVGLESAGLRGSDCVRRAMLAE